MFRSGDEISKILWKRATRLPDANLISFMGQWQKSDVPALQAAINGSVTRLCPPI